MLFRSLLPALLVALAGRSSAQGKTPPNALWVSPDDGRLQYFGRIGFDDPKAPTFYYSATGFRTRFRGASIALRFAEDGYGPANSFGVRVDGGPEIPVQLVANSDQTYVAVVGLPNRVHDLVVYRRQDTYGGVATFKGMWLDKGARLLDPPKRPTRKIEFFGDSVTGGDAVTAFGFEAKPDGAVSYENSDAKLNDGWWSFAAVAARRLNADANIEGIGGLPLLDHTGWFGGSLDADVGLETTWDKLDPIPGQFKPWDFSRFTPDVVVVAIGQNDSHGGDIHDPAFHARWVATYERVLEGLRGHYPKARFVLTTTILGHDLAWDRALQEIAASYEKEHPGLVRYFGFKNVGRGTPGHPRVAEEDEMGRELADYLSRLPGIGGR